MIISLFAEKEKFINRHISDVMPSEPASLTLSAMKNAVYTDSPQSFYYFLENEKVAPLGRYKAIIEKKSKNTFHAIITLE